MHEMGHTAFGLADEYSTYAGCSSGETGHNTYSGSEPTEQNVTANITTLKWQSLVTAGHAHTHNHQRRLHQVRYPGLTRIHRNRRRFRRSTLLPLRHLPPGIRLPHAQHRRQPEILRRLPQRNHEQDQALRPYNSHTYADTNAYTYSHTYADSNAHTNADTHTNSNADPHSYAYTNSNAYSHTNAYSNADANPDADANPQHRQRCLLPVAAVLPDTRAGSGCAAVSRRQRRREATLWPSSELSASRPSWAWLQQRDWLPSSPSRKTKTRMDSRH